MLAKKQGQTRPLTTKSDARRICPKILPARVRDTNSSFELPDQTCRHFTLAEIQSATQNFCSALVIGRGGFGMVYRSSSLIGSVSEVAIKRLDSISNQGAVEYAAKIQSTAYIINPNNGQRWRRLWSSWNLFCGKKEKVSILLSFISMVRSFFAGKAELWLAGAVGSESETNAYHIQKSNNRGLRTFTYAELVSATNNFQNEEYSATLLDIIYKGWVDERTYAPTSCGVGLPMYVRKTVKLDLKPEEFNHPNLVKLLGYCLNEQELFWVYELVSDTSLDEHVFRGAAEGLSVLYQRKHHAYIQLKTSLIRLDTDFNARLSDFEMEKSSLALVSYSFGMDAFYAAPEWFRYQADKFDSNYSGLFHFDDVILLEILTGMKVFDVNRPYGKQNLVNWATPLLADEVNLGMIMDPKFWHNSYPPKGAFKLALLVSKCLQPTPNERPLMEEILQVLYQCYREGTTK
ncbi:Protein kinase, ATP binding site-containing protein [Cynara cardunculus var. scolymus]|uniref:Protein kinase, ATP binding site-containing protein n=1 Tax=Cynara cardunculus var. scolymus TaxID=59895 RepID=A0A103Y2X7_CYNCS|nr:Protein kinase, ATP binding site-containing protein [Cynara cardunculus var. scolymus]